VFQHSSFVKVKNLKVLEVENYQAELYSDLILCWKQTLGVRSNLSVLIFLSHKWSVFLVFIVVLDSYFKMNWNTLRKRPFS
jgi:hypothetical protein